MSNFENGNRSEIRLFDGNFKPLCFSILNLNKIDKVENHYHVHFSVFQLFISV